MAALIAPPARPPLLIMSAMSLLSSSRYSGPSGSSQTGSPARAAAWRTAEIHAGGVPKSPVVTLPRATTQAPVSVATSTRCVAPRCLAYHRPSPRISRPSASVLLISTVRPDAPRITSPGLSALPPGMFSVAGTTATTRRGTPSRAIARTAATTAAAPAMSSFIRSMPSAGLIEMPPVSKVTPLPTRPRTGPSVAPGGV